MAEFPAVSPLLDGFTVGECFSSHDGVSCYDLRHDASGQSFVLKHISVPESEAKIQALLLSGAYTDKEAANEYFKRVADGYAEEFALSKSFSDCPYILHYLSHQVVAREDNAGFDVYAVADKAVPLKTYMAENAMTKLQAVNLGIDLCAALCAIRDAGYLHQNIKPENIFLDRDRFLLGDLGMTALQDMKYSSLPEQYIGAYTAPELHDIMAEQNETTDLYAVGMLLYRIYNGDHAPYEDEHVTAKEADRMRLSGKELPAPMFADYELAEILLKACAFKKEDRYQTPQEMKQALEFYMQRNGTNDTLIVPPIVSDPEPEAEAEPLDDETAMPVRFADVSAMDEDFIRHFAPDTAALDAAIAEIRQDDEKEAAAQPEKEPIPEVFPDLPEIPDEPEEPAQEEETVEATPEEPEEAPNTPEKAVTGSLVIKGIETIPDSTQEEELQAEPKELTASQEDLPKNEAFEAPRAELTMIEDEQSEGNKSSSGRRRGHRHRRQKEEDAYGEKTQKKAAKRRKIRSFLLSGLLLLVVAAVFVYFFTPLGQRVYHYFINIESFEVSEVTADSVSVRLTTNVSDPPLEVFCTDSYGNRFDAPLTGKSATFTGLNSGTQYTVCAVLRKDDGPHRLSGPDRLTASTLPSTEILEMTASAVNEEGAVEIGISVFPGDPEPSSWTVSYCCEGGTSQERSFRGTEHSFRITGLEVGKEYTFTLLSSDLAKLIGKTSVTFTPDKQVTAENIKMVSFVDGKMTVAWDCTSDAPETWTVTCTDPDGGEQKLTCTECKAVFTGLQPGTPYTVTLEAPGLFVPLSLEVPDTLVHIDKFTATEEDDGIHMAWSCPSVPDGNWLLISVVGGERDSMVSRNVEGSSTVLTDLMPDTKYTLVLRSADDYTAVGHYLIEFEMPKPEQFDARGFSAADTVLKTFAVPEEEDWQAKDLETEKTAFDAADQIVYKLLAPTDRYKGSFSLLYVLRDENGVPVSSGSNRFVWNEVWAWDNDDAFSMAGTVDAPDKNGTYTLELYFSLDTEGYIRYQSVAVSAPITVTGAPEE